MFTDEAIRIIEDMDWLQSENLRSHEHLEAWKVIKAYAQLGQRYEDEEQDGVHDTDA
jgi:hypothetical protein